jgi:hypothetical protein
MDPYRDQGTRRAYTGTNPLSLENRTFMHPIQVILHMEEGPNLREKLWEGNQKVLYVAIVVVVAVVIIIGLWLSGVGQSGPLTGNIVDPWAFVSHFELHNDGWFVAKLACYYSTDGGVTWKESSSTGGIAMTDYVYMPLDALGVPDRALVKIHVIVVGGKDRTGSTVFEYYKDSFYDQGPTWTYYISGTTLNPELDGAYGPS